jgi:PAS domain-containing protein
MRKFFQFTGVFQKADPALALTLKFVLVGIIWILFSDSFLFILGAENFLWKLAHIHILKGLFFVGVTGAFLFYWMNHFANTIQAKEAEINKVFYSSPVAMGVLNADTFRFIEANESLQKMYGIPFNNFLELTLSDLAEDKERFESVPILIKTGWLQLGIWKQVTKDKRVFSVELSAHTIRNKKAYLITFINVTNEVRIKNEMTGMKEGLEQRMNERISQLTRMNEELAYRASQTEHVNTELISVNEQLQYVNKKVAIQLEAAARKYEQLNKIMVDLTEVVWSFDLTGIIAPYVSPSAKFIYEDSEENFARPWFWLDYLHPDESGSTQIRKQQLNEQGQTSCTYRIITKKGTTRLIFDRIRLIQHENGSTYLVGCAVDISNIKSFTGQGEVAARALTTQF